MITFEYRAIQTDGAISQGTIEAEGRHDAMQKMSAKGLKPVSLAERKGAASAASGAKDESGSFKIDLGPRKITARMLEDFTRLLSSLLSAGIPLSRALVILYREAPSAAAKAKWKEVHDLVIDGLPLADAMAKSPDVFPRVYVAMVQAGEAGGFLDLVLNQIADFQARDKDLRAKMISAMLYPVILLVLAIGVLIFLMVFFIPQFQKIFAGFGAQLPMITQIIVGISHIIRSYGLIVAVVAAIAIYAIRNWFKTPQGSRFWENLLLRSPIAGTLVSKFAMSRFCRMLGTLLGAGVPLINGLQVARKSLGNQILVDAVSDSIERVQKGEPLGVSLGGCKKLFNGAVLEMIAVAEETGKLDQELVRLANVTESDLDRQLKTAVAFAEPLMLFFIAGFIGTIFIGMVIPIFTMQDYIK